MLRALIFVVAGVSMLSAQPGPSGAPAVGSKVPDFEASDQDGVRRSLHSIMGPKGAMLVFFRSADW
jgi:hypothetical protein